MQETTAIIQGLKEDIREGLCAEQKYIPSKYFYDDEGSRIFSRIMRMPSYYLTDSEFTIFSEHKEEILQEIKDYSQTFDLVELGAGDGMKTSLLIEHFIKAGAGFKYVPIDISEEALEQLTVRMKQKFKYLTINGLTGDYFEVLESLNICEKCLKVALFLGSNIGNYTHSEQVDFFKRLSAALNPGDLVLTGFDLVKDPSVILQAYNDPEGLTREFNFNLLRRLNRELNADFNISKFQHSPVYDPGQLAAKSYLLSTEKQQVTLGELDMTVYFDAWEPIFTEVSHKFTEKMIRDLADETGYEIVRNFHDDRHYFADSLWIKQ